jgi:glutamate racemase
LTTVGVFDSGVGGLSVLRALRAELPQVHFVYLADNAHAPYGERATQVVLDRAHRLTEQLRAEHRIDALVIACNTATALAIDELQHSHPDMPFIGVEPALKPAATLTRNGHIGVLATRSTGQSARFAQLLERVSATTAQPLHVRVQPCDGLADAIERADPAAIHERAAFHLKQLRAQAPSRPPIDTLVLGCTHYPFASDILQALCGSDVQLVDTGEPVAPRARAVLKLETPSGTTDSGTVTLLSTGKRRPVEHAASRWLGIEVQAAAA